MRSAFFLVILLVVLAGAGCATTRSLSTDIREDRDAAYRHWVKMRQEARASQTAIRGNLHLEDAVKLALQQNKELQAAFQEKEVARGKVLESYAEALPKVTAKGTYTRLDRVNTFDVGGISISLGGLDNYSIDLVVSQPIFRGGAIPSALRAAKLAELLSDEQVRAKVQETIYNVALAYYDALLYQHEYEVNKEAVRSAEAHLQDVLNKREHGVASDYDVLRAQVDVSNFRAEMIKQRNNVDIAKSRLLKAMGVIQKGDVTLADKLFYRPMSPVLQEALRIAHQNRPDLYQAEIKIRLQKEALRVARSEYWPKVDAFFEELLGKPDPTSITRNEWNDTWKTGISVSLSIFDGLRREGRIRQERATLDRNRYELANAQERAFLEIRQALLTLQHAEEFVESQKRNLERASEGLRLAEVGYREGINSQVEVVDARAALTKAKGLYYEAVYAHVISRLNLERAMGILGPSQGDRLEDYVPAEGVFTGAIEGLEQGPPGNGSGEMMPPARPGGS